MDTKPHKTLAMFSMALAGFLSEATGISWYVDCRKDFEDRTPICFNFHATRLGEDHPIMTDSLSWGDILGPEGLSLDALETIGELLLAHASVHYDRKA